MSEAKPKKRRMILTVLRAAVVCIAIVWGIRWASEPETRQDLVATFGRLNLLAFGAALLIFMGGQVIVGFRWWLLLRSQGVHIKIAAAVKLHYLGLFYNNFMPSSVGGDLVRAWYVTKHHHKRFEGALSVFVDRAIGLASTFVIAGFFYFVFLRGGIIAGRGEPSTDAGLLSRILDHRFAILGVLGVLAVAICVFLVTPHGRRAAGAALSRLWKMTAKVGHKGRDAAVLYCKSPLTIAAAFGLTVGIQLITITGFWLVGRSLGIEASPKYYYVFFTLTWVLGAIPVSIGGAGIVEGSLYYLFTTVANVARAPAMGLALCQRVVWMLASLPGAAVHLLGAHLPKNFSIDDEQGTD